mgnify:CR=1 FL=1
MSGDNLVSVFLQRVSERGDHGALLIKQQEQFVSITWNQLFSDVSAAASVLDQLDVGPGNRVALVSENRYEWIVCDLAIQMIGAVHVPIHSTLSAEQVVWQIEHSESKVVLLSGPDQASKLAQQVDTKFAKISILCFDSSDIQINGHKIQSLHSMMSSTVVADLDSWEQVARTIRSDDLATILYTSGTTGEPKGVMLTHGNLVSNARSTVESFPTEADVCQLSFLPFSHVFARTCDIYTWLERGTVIALAERRETVLADCAQVRPSMITGVPYFYDRVYRHLVESGVADKPGVLRDLFGGKIRYCVSGGAALPTHVFEFFHSQDVPLLEGYGMTECSPVIALSTPEFYKSGCVGRPLTGVEVKIAVDGEIVTRGPHVMRGYWKDEPGTEEILRDGWLHTGDIGCWNDSGFLQITGRKKELIITSGGKNIAPVLIESLLTQDPLILQAMVIGDGRKYLSVLIVPNPDRLRDEIISRQLVVSNRAEALAHPTVVSLYDQRIKERLAGLSDYEQVQKFCLLDRGFTLETGELTPKLSLRRKVIESHFKLEIDTMY